MDQTLLDLVKDYVDIKYEGEEDVAGNNWSMLLKQ